MRYPHRISVLIAAAAIASLSGCATPKFQSLQPDAVRADGYSVALLPADAPIFSNITKPIAQDETVIYTQVAGGSLAAGLLLGPLAVAANTVAVNNTTKADTEFLRDHIHVDTKTMFAEAASAQGFKIGDNALARAKPYLHVTRVKDTDTVLLSAEVLVEYEQPGNIEAAGKWSGKYVYQLPGTYTRASIHNMDDAGSQAVAAEAANGFAELAKYMHDESPEQIQQEKKITFASQISFPSVYGDLAFYGSLIADKGDVIWIRSVGAVFALRKSDTTYKPI